MKPLWWALVLSIKAAVLLWISLAVSCSLTLKLHLVSILKSKKHYCGEKHFEQFLINQDCTNCHQWTWNFFLGCLKEGDYIDNSLVIGKSSNSHYLLLFLFIQTLIWNGSNGNQLQKLPNQGKETLDVLPFAANGNDFMAAIDEQKLTIYKWLNVWYCFCWDTCNKAHQAAAVLLWLQSHPGIICPQ